MATNLMGEAKIAMARRALATVENLRASGMTGSQYVAAVEAAFVVAWQDRINAYRAQQKRHRAAKARERYYHLRAHGQIAPANGGVGEG